MMHAVIDSVSDGVPAVLVGIRCLGRTLKQRAVDVLAFFDRPGTSNGPTQATNGCFEVLRGSALGFRNLSNYIARSLLEIGGFKPLLHFRLRRAPPNSDKPEQPVVQSIAETTLGVVRARNAITIRNRHKASHAKNKTVFIQRITSTSPKPHCNTSPARLSTGRCTPRMAEPAGGADLRDRVPCRPLRTLITEREQLVVGSIAKDIEESLLNPFLDLGQVRVRISTPVAGLCVGLARVSGCDVPGDGMVRTAGRLGRGTKRSGPIVGSAYLHDFSVKLHSGYLPGLLMRLGAVIKAHAGAPTSKASGEARSSHGHQRPVEHDR